MLRLAGCSIALILLIACGLPAGQRVGAVTPSPSLAGALAMWKDFPADASPRPIVVFDRTLEYIGAAGFTSEADRKVAWLCNNFVAAPGVSLPESAPATATAGGHSYAAIGAREAYAELIAARARISQQTGCAALAPFVIKDVRWQTARFPTDRGMMAMSAWLFDIAGLDAYIGYSAVDPSALWRHGISPQGQGGRLSADGLTLTLEMTGGPDTPGACGEDLIASAAESGSAVAIAITPVFHTPPAGTACTAAGYAREVSVRLSRPLGGRVLIDPGANAGMVCETPDC